MEDVFVGWLVLARFHPPYVVLVGSKVQDLRIGSVTGGREIRVCGGEMPLAGMGFTTAAVTAG